MIEDIISLYADRWKFFLNLTLQHIGISGVAIGAAAVIGLGLGIGIGQYWKSASYVSGLTNFIYTIPSIALFGFLIPFSGIGNTTAVIALSVYALLTMVHNTYTGITGIDPEIIEAVPAGLPVFVPTGSAFVYASGPASAGLSAYELSYSLHVIK